MQIFSFETCLICTVSVATKFPVSNAWVTGIFIFLSEHIFVEGSLVYEAWDQFMQEVTSTSYDNLLFWLLLN
jgi:hypothetical protein